jgi:hypothetical protein
MLISQVKLISMRRFASYSKHAKLVINHGYNVVIDPYSYHNIIMKLIILRLNIANKPSPMSEGVAKIWINNQPWKGINLTRWHTQARRTPRVATVHDTVKESGRILPPLVSSSMRLPRRTHRGRPNTIPYNIHKEVGYRPTRWHMTLLSLGIPYVPYAPVHFKCLFNRAQPTRALIDTGGRYHLGAPNIISDHSSSFPSSILHFPLIALLGLQLYQPFDHLAKPHRTSIDRKGLIVSGFQPLAFYR